MIPMFRIKTCSIVKFVTVWVWPLCPGTWPPWNAVLPLPAFLPALGLFKWAPPLFFVWLILSHFIFSHLYSYILGRVFKSPSQGPLLCTSAAHTVAQVMAWLLLSCKSWLLGLGTGTCLPVHHCISSRQEGPSEENRATRHFQLNQSLNYLWSQYCNF